MVLNNQMPRCIQKFIGASVAIDWAIVDKTIIAGATFVRVNFAGATFVRVNFAGAIVVRLEQLSWRKCLFFRRDFSEQFLPEQMIVIEIHPNWMSILLSVLTIFWLLCAMSILINFTTRYSVHKEGNYIFF